VPSILVLLRAHRLRAALAVAFFATQILLVLSSADRISEPDLAEVGLMELGDAWAQGETASVDQVLRAVRAGPNAAHGGYVFVALLYAALAALVGSSYLALKVVVIGIATVGLLAWTAVADRIGGRYAALAAGLMIFFAPPSGLGGRLVAWGSHPESATFLGLAALAVLSASRSLRGAILVGGAVGACLGFNRLTLAAVGVLAVGWAVHAWRDDRRAHVAFATVVAAAVLGGWMAVTGGWNASVTETPGNTPIGLLASAGTTFIASLLSFLPLRVVPVHATSLAPFLDVSLSMIAVALAFISIRSPGARLLGLALAAHLVFIAVLAPQRPSVPARYLLPIWPLLAVVLALGLARLKEKSPALALVGLVAWVTPGLVQTVVLVDLGRAEAFFDYRPQEYAPKDIGKVTFASAPGVNDFLSRRPNDAAAFRLAGGSGAGQDLLMRPAPHPVDPAGIRRQIDAWAGVHSRSGPARSRRLEAVGWGLAVFAADRPGVRRSALISVRQEDREALAHGIGMGLRALGVPLDLWDQDPDAAAIREGARRLEAEVYGE
jgi:hypothetical protein